MFQPPFTGIRLRHALLVAIPASNLVIARKLENIASTRQIRTSAADHKRSIIIDLLISLGVPLIYVALMIVNQPNRFGIIEQVGCWPILWESWVWVLLVAAPVLVVSVVSAIYSGESFPVALFATVRPKLIIPPEYSPGLPVVLDSSAPISSGAGKQRFDT